MHESHFVDVLFQLLDQVPFGDLLVEEVIEEFHLRMVHSLDDLEPFRHRRQVVPRVLFGIDVFEQQPHILPVHKLRRLLQSVDAALVLNLARHARHHSARHDDDRRAFDLGHRAELFLQVGKKGLADAGVADAVGESRRSVEGETERSPLAVGSAEVVLGPLLVLAD